MPRYFVAYVAALAVLAVLDALWLGAVAKDFYRGQIGPLMAEQVRFGVAACFYLLYIVGVVVFAVVPALAAESVTRALMLGALFGFFAT
ncbi:putative membrane protein [Methylibium sp. T29]|nr:putative membrane protein [Methylibium sp. T29]